MCNGITGEKIISLVPFFGFGLNDMLSLALSPNGQYLASGGKPVAENKWRDEKYNLFLWNFFLNDKKFNPLQLSLLYRMRWAAQAKKKLTLNDTDQATFELLDKEDQEKLTEWMEKI